MRTLLILLRKEFILFRKNKFLPKVAFIFPCMVILVIPLVTTMGVRHVSVSVVSRDNSTLTQNVISDLISESHTHVSPVAAISPPHRLRNPYQQPGRTQI